MTRRWTRKLMVTSAIQVGSGCDLQTAQCCQLSARVSLLLPSPIALVPMCLLKAIHSCSPLLIMSIRLSSSARRASSQLNAFFTRRTCCAKLTLQRSFWNGARRATSATEGNGRALFFAGMAGLVITTVMAASTVFLDAVVEPTRSM